MALQWLVHFFLWCLSLATISSSSSSSMNMDCQRRCGKISIPYPFGMGNPTCFRNQWFNVTCDESVTPPKARLGFFLDYDFEVLDIFLEGQLKTKQEITHECRSKSYNDSDGISIPLPFNGSPYTFSNTRNKFTAIGCNTLASMTGYTALDAQIFRFGCMSSCSGTAFINGSCTGTGCCQSSIPPRIVGFQVAINRLSDMYSLGLCSYAFLVEQDFNLNFSVFNLSSTNFLGRNKQVPVVLDWVASHDETCEEATDSACVSEKSICCDSTNGPGYSCKCSPGYQGNPYVHGGCIDIDECKDKKTHNCKQMCINMPGSYDCKCQKGYHGDGRNNGTGCTADAKKFPVLKVILGTVLITLFLLITSICTIRFWKKWMKRRARELHKKFFQRNGGLILQQKIYRRHSGDAFKIFTLKKLKRATNNFNASTIVGQGGFGIVYKGVLPNDRIVAIKKSKLVDARQIEQFINELDILSQINHRNVVKLVGCCLEDQVPILVYEFISNGTLYHHIHEAGNLPSISLENRLRIATEIAEALAYLHSTASMPIFHRDVKSANILLDNNLIAKVADFGVSRLVPIDHSHITTLVQGTWGYLDLESFQTGKLTDKSDVYSFGVVFVELLTGEKAVCLNRPQEDRNLATYFVRAMQENCLFQMLEERVRSEASEEQLMTITQLAIRCLRFKGDERPTMKEVLVDLQVLRRFQDTRWVHDQETERLLYETSQSCTEDAGGQYSMENHFDMSLTLNR